MPQRSSLVAPKLTHHELDEQRTIVTTNAIVYNLYVANATSGNDVVVFTDNDGAEVMRVVLRREQSFESSQPFLIENGLKAENTTGASATVTVTAALSSETV
jgi:hypothetical protein